MNTTSTSHLHLNAMLLRTLDSVLAIPSVDMVDMAGITKHAWYSMRRNPENVTVKQLVSLSNAFHVPVRRFFSSGATDLVGCREDYVEPDFRPCSYDAGILMRYINACPGATWQKAADAVGMTRDNLRHSLLGDTRTPVVRFLASCEALDVDPFSVLIDPNPVHCPSARRTPSSGVADIAALQRRVDALQSELDDLKTKFEALMRRSGTPFADALDNPLPVAAEDHN